MRTSPIIGQVIEFLILQRDKTFVFWENRVLHSITLQQIFWVILDTSLWT